MKTIGIIGNFRKPQLWDLLPGLVEWLQEHNVTVVLSDRLVGPAYDPPPEVQVHPAGTLVRHVEMMLSIGGDGTLLSTIRVVGKAQVPILGIHMGGLGFLAEVTMADTFKALEEVLAGKYNLEDRMVLAVDLVAFLVRKRVG
ncbi:MAG: NAD(+)/NADH kinase [Candidatus Marinimicrobia bacterium]|nr:NAD(+)/NADH kinase [Candidatus Neomarinimicrobiota bacterium]